LLTVYILYHVSGDPVNYTNFDANRKDPLFHAIEDCVGFGVSSAGYDGTWEDLRCGKLIHYLCQFGKNSYVP